MKKRLHLLFRGILNVVGRFKQGSNQKMLR